MGALRERLGTWLVNLGWRVVGSHPEPEACAPQDDAVEFEEEVAGPVVIGPEAAAMIAPPPPPPPAKPPPPPPPAGSARARVVDELARRGAR